MNFFLIVSSISYMISKVNRLNQPNHNKLQIKVSISFQKVNFHNGSSRFDSSNITKAN